MISYPSVPTFFTIRIALSSVYPGYKPGIPDAEADTMAFIHSLLSAGIAPSSITVEDLKICVLTFPDWRSADECDRAVRSVLDLMWLIDSTGDIPPGV